MNTQDIRQEDLEVETEAVETTLHIQTGVQAGGFWDNDTSLGQDVEALFTKLFS